MSNYFRAINEDFGKDTEHKETKEYYADVRIDWGTSFEAKNKEDFVIKLKEQYPPSNCETGYFLYDIDEYLMEDWDIVEDYKNEIL